MKINELGEFGLIDRLRKKLPGVSAKTILGIGDDASIFQTDSAYDLVMSTDMLVEDVHFASHTMSYEDIGWKALAASVSDIAAMGASPRQALLSLAIPPLTRVEDLEELYQGVADLATLYAVDIVGGDTVKSKDQLVLSVTLTGEVQTGRSLLRSGAKVGDVLFVTGTVGGSAAALDYLTTPGRISLDAKQQETLLAFHRRPLPQVKVGSWLSQSGAGHALNDISDGIASESNELAQASRVVLEVYREALPLAPEVILYCKINELDPVSFALYGGEDYQLIGTLSESRWEEAVAACEQLGSPIHRIGRVVASGEPQVILFCGSEPLSQQDQTQEILVAKGYNHFRS